MPRSRRTLRPLLALVLLGIAAALAGTSGAAEWGVPCADWAPPVAPEEGSPGPEPADADCPEPGAEPPTPGETHEAEPAPEEVEPEPLVDAPPSPPPATDPAPPARERAPAERPSPALRIARAPLTITPPLAGGPYVFPVLGPVSYSDTWGAARATVAWHHGVDVFAPLGAPIVAVADGTVFSVGWNRIGGWRLWLRDREGNYFYYAHLSAFSPYAVDGARVRAGTVLGFVGNTGDAAGTPYHLHFEIHPVSLLHLGYDGAVNPTPYLAGWQRLDAAAVSLAAGLRWGWEGLGAAAGRTVAPPAGAVLLGYSDISSADAGSTGTLAPAPLDEATLAAPELPALDDLPEEAAEPVERVPLDPAHVQVVLRLEREASSPAAFGGGVWDRLADCEASGDWGANTGNGYFGGLQFHPHTWLAHGGGGHAPTADEATREEQIAVAARVLVSQGWNAWPVCSRQLGLR